MKKKKLKKTVQVAEPTVEDISLNWIQRTLLEEQQFKEEAEKRRQTYDMEHTNICKRKENGMTIKSIFRLIHKTTKEITYRAFDKLDEAIEEKTELDFANKICSRWGFKSDFQYPLALALVECNFKGEYIYLYQDPFQEPDYQIVDKTIKVHEIDCVDREKKRRK